MAATGGAIEWSARLRGLPAITLQVIADPRRQHFKGFQLRTTTVQVDVWAIDAGTAEDLREMCIAVLVPATTIGPVKFQRGQIAGLRSGPEPEQGGTMPQRDELFRESIDFIFTHNAN
jgi:hypothetical protein